MAITANPPDAARAAFDPDVLLAYLDGSHRELRQQIREELSRPELAPELGLSLPEYRERVSHWVAEMGQAGFGVPGYPRQYGGEDDPAGNIVGFETVAHGDLSLLVKFGVQFGLWGGAIQQLGTAPHHDRYLAATARTEILGCFAMTEHDHGSNVQELETTATYDPEAEEFVIHTPHAGARKDYIGGAGETASVAAVFAQLIVADRSEGVHCFVVDIRDADGHDLPGIQTADDGLKVGLNGVDNGSISFDQVRVPRAALLNRYASVSAAGEYTSSIDNPDKRFFTMLGTLVQGRICVGAASLSAAKNALTIAVRYAQRRVQFGPDAGAEIAVMRYPAHRRKLLPRLARTFALYCAQQELTEKFAAVISAGDEAEESARRELESLAAGLKAANTWHAMDTIQACREACGGAGYMAENRLGILREDIDVFTTFEGDNTVLTMLCARGVITGYAHEIGALNPVGLAGFLAGMARDVLTERTFAHKIGQSLSDAMPSSASRAESEERSLRDPDHLRELFRWRQGHITASVANRFRVRMKRMDQFEVLLDVQPHLLLAGSSFIDTFVFSAFQRAVERCPDSAAQAILADLLALHGLSSVEANKGFFQEHARLSASRCKQVTREVDALLAELAPHAPALVDAFGIPDAVLAAPIGRRSGYAT